NARWNRLRAACAAGWPKQPAPEPQHQRRPDMDMRVNPRQKMKLVMVGNGMAGVRTLEELLRIAPDLYDITVFGAEPHPNYNRILLSPVLAGEQTLEEIVLNDWSWYQEHGITLHAGWQVTSVDRAKRVVNATNAQGETIS